MLVGEGTGPKWDAKLKRLGWGRMWIEKDVSTLAYEGEPWGFDNGAFRDWKDGLPFDTDRYRVRLERAVSCPTKPILAVVPDAPGTSDETLRMFDEWRPILSDDFPWYIAVQDGMEPVHIEGYPIDGVFLGGTNAYKATAAEWCAWAHSKGLRFHYGRCGTLNKVAHALQVGADSLDSAFPMWNKERWTLFVDAVSNGPAQGDLFYA